MDIGIVTVSVQILVTQCGVCLCSLGHIHCSCSTIMEHAHTVMHTSVHACLL